MTSAAVRIPYANLAAQHAALRDELLAAVGRVLDHGKFILGPEVGEYEGRRVGSFGDVGCFSLHPLKTLNACGDGGVLTTADKVIAARLRELRNIGLKTRDECVVWSGNSRLDTLQAALLLVKLAHLDEWTERRRANAAVYRRLLADVRQIRLPADGAGERAVYHTFVIQAERR